MNYWLSICVVTMCGLIQVNDATVVEELKQFASVLASHFEILNSPDYIAIDVEHVTLSFLNKSGEITLVPINTYGPRRLAEIAVLSERNGIFEVKSYLVKIEWLRRNMHRDIMPAVVDSLTMGDLINVNCTVKYTKDGNTYNANTDMCPLPKAYQRPFKIDCSFYVFKTSTKEYKYKRLFSYFLQDNFEPETRPCPPL